MVCLWLFLRLTCRFLILVSCSLYRLYCWYHRARKGPPHGSARFATRREIRRAGLTKGIGPIIGRIPGGPLVRFTQDGLMMVFAATGAGKGLGIVIPTLLDYPGSMLVTDPKGENYNITANYRRSIGTVRLLNPSNLAESDRFNPMQMIRIDTDMEADDAKALAKLMVKPDSREAHWDDKSVSLLTALILHALRAPHELRNLAYVRTLSIGGAETFRATLEEIAGGTSHLAAEIAAGFLSQIPQRPASKAGEFESILSNVQKATEPWSGGSPAGKLSACSTFDLSELTTQTTTLYLCVDEELLPIYDRWLRVLTGCVITQLTRAKHTPRKGPKVILLLDEVAVLGPLDSLQRQSGLLRAYCTPVLIWQNLPQVRMVYGEAADAFLANATCRVFFGVNDNQTAEYASQMLGFTTTISSSSSVSGPVHHLTGRQKQTGTSESGYWLLDASEIQRLPTAILFAKLRNLAFPVCIQRISYRKS